MWAHTFRFFFVGRGRSRHSDVFVCGQRGGYFSFGRGAQGCCFYSCSIRIYFGSGPHTASIGRSLQRGAPADEEGQNAVWGRRCFSVLAVLPAPMQSPCALGAPRIILSVDGSAFFDEDGSALAGWGLTVAFSQPLCSDYCGPIVLDSLSANYLGAAEGTNNNGELTGLYYALCWIRDYAGSSPVQIDYDSVYAANVTQRIWRARTNFRLVLNCRQAYDAVASRLICWNKVAAHTGDILNERADGLAKCGARGFIRSDSAHRIRHVP